MILQRYYVTKTVTIANYEYFKRDKHEKIPIFNMSNAQNMVYRQLAKN